jgi:hypothetical protein
MIWPFMPLGWAAWVLVKKVLGSASTKPSPSVLSEARKVRTLSAPPTRSWILGLIARSLNSEPPGGS